MTKDHQNSEFPKPHNKSERSSLRTPDFPLEMSPTIHVPMLMNYNGKQTVLHITHPKFQDSIMINLSGFESFFLL